MTHRSPITVARLLSAALCTAAACCACAALVTPNSASSYVFSSPRYPAHIRGLVMGDPPAYRTVRSEDADWFAEAFLERLQLRQGTLPSPEEVLVPEFGNWPISATNRFSRWTTAVDAAGVTNIVVGYNLVTNSAPMLARAHAKSLDVYRLFPLEILGYDDLDNGRCDPSRYLDATAPTTATARVAYDWEHPPVLTNVYTAINFRSVTTNGHSSIVMPMTNGTVSVHDNNWTYSYLEPYTAPATNVRNAVILDYCHNKAGMFPGFTNDFTGAFYRDLAFQPESFARAYAALRGAVRLAEETTTTNHAPPVVSYTRTFDESIPFHREQWYTNSYSRAGAGYSVEGSAHYVYSWNASTQSYDKYQDIKVYASETPEYHSISPSRFPSELVTTGDTVRVSVYAAFAVVDFQYRRLIRTGGIPNQQWTAVDSIEKAVVVPVPGAALLTGLGDDALVGVQLNSRYLLDAAAAAAGVPAPPASVPGYNPPMGQSHFWAANCKSLAVIYQTHPTAKFNNW